MLENKAEEAESELRHVTEDTMVVMKEQEEVGFSC